VDDKLKKRITMFYIAGAVNVVIGVYVLVFGRSFLSGDKYLMVVLFFLGFAALDFYFPSMLRKKWLQEKAKYEEQQRKLDDKPPLA
jgi:drug/metabolite transporter (DMT)-like permease